MPHDETQSGENIEQTVIDIRKDKSVLEEDMQSTIEDTVQHINNESSFISDSGKILVVNCN